MILNFFFFLEEHDSVALFFFLNGYIEEIIEENPEMETIVNARGGLPVTMDDWYDWLRDEVVGIGMTAEEEEVIRSNFELISFFVYFLIFFWFFCLISSFFSSLFLFFSFLFLVFFLFFENFRENGFFLLRVL